MVMASNRALKVEHAGRLAAMLLGVLNNQAGPAKDIVALNAGVALYAANVAHQHGKPAWLLRDAGH